MGQRVLTRDPPKFIYPFDPLTHCVCQLWYSLVLWKQYYPLRCIFIICDTYDETELVEAVYNVQQRSFATLVEVRSLEQSRRPDPVCFGSVVEVLNVTHRDEAAWRFRVEGRLGQAGSLR